MALIDIVVSEGKIEFATSARIALSNRNVGASDDTTLIGIDADLATITQLLDLRAEGTQVFQVSSGGSPTFAGGTLTDTLVINNDAPLELNGRFKVDLDNLGAPGHEASGPRLFITDMVDDRLRFAINSLGQLQVYLQDESLPNNTTGHGLQVRRRATGSGAAAGLGAGIQFFVEDDAGDDREVGNLQVALTNATAAGISSYVQLVGRSAGAGVSLLRCFGATGEVQAIASGGWYSTNWAASANHGQFNAGDGSFDGVSAGRFAGLAGGTGFAANVTTGFTGRIIDFQRAGVSLFRVNGANGQVVATLSDTANTSSGQPLILDHVLTSGSPAAGFGTSLVMRTKDSSAGTVVGGQIDAAATTVTPGAVTSNVLFKHIKAGSVTTAFNIDVNSNLATGFKLLATGGIGVGNSAAATTPGSVTRKIEIFDAAGASLGFVPVYDAIS